MVMIPRKKDAAVVSAAAAIAADQEKKQAAPTVATSTPGPAAQPAATAGAVAVAATGAVSTGVNGKPRDVIGEQFKDAFRVDWNTLHRIQAVQGSFVDVENSKTEFGKSMLFELLSYQDNWQISPGTDAESDAQHVRYSNDGITTTMGENCAEFLAALKEAGYSEAKMGHRCTLAGTIIASDSAEMTGKMVQIDLPPTSKTMFDRFRLQTSMDIAKGIKTEEQVNPMKMTAKSQTKGRNTWTIVEFTYA